MKKLLLITALWILALTGVTLAQTQTARFQLTWLNGTPLPDGSNTPTGTKIFRSDNGAGGTYNLVGTVAWPQNTFQDQILNDPGSKIYCWYVKSTNSFGDSPSSNTICSTSNPVPPLTSSNPPFPMNVNVTILTATNIQH